MKYEFGMCVYEREMGGRKEGEGEEERWGRGLNAYFQLESKFNLARNSTIR